MGIKEIVQVLLAILLLIYVVLRVVKSRKG